MPTQITTPIGATDNFKTRNEKRRAIYDYYNGEGAYDAGTMEDARLGFQTLAGETINDGDPITDWRLVINGLNEPAPRWGGATVTWGGSPAIWGAAA